MKRQFKMISMILVMTLMITGFTDVKTAIQVEGKTQTEPNVKIVLLNEDIDETVKEPVFQIKNRTDSKIKVKKVEFQVKQNGTWVSYSKKKTAKTTRNIKIAKGKSAYDSIVLAENYSIPSKGLATGKYGIYVKYKYRGKTYVKRKTFYIENSEDEVKESSENTETSKTPETTYGNSETPQETQKAEAPKPAPPAATTTDKSVNETNTATVISKGNVQVLNYDFSVNNKGKGRAMIFTEGSYRKTDWVKICLKLQKRYKTGWKKYKKYTIKKKSNVAFANKTVQLKSEGTYRMVAKITFYKKGKKKEKQKIVTKSIIYKGR